MSRARVRLRIHGHVQGVFFRVHARQRAQALGLAGWVRNREDGTVEAVAEGDPQAVRQFVAWARRGPPSALVERVDVETEPPGEEGSGFRIRD